MTHRTVLLVLFVLAVAALVAPDATVAAPCTFTTAGTTMTLDGDCSTSTSVVVPDGFTLDGNGFTITAVDPPGTGSFKGGVIQAGPGTTAHVTRLGVTANNLKNVCDSGANRLRGILFEGASGSITNNDVIGINQGPSGCQEGNAIEVRNFESRATVAVQITDNVVARYQKTGIVVNGNVDATISGNVVTGAGPIGYIAQNGIQVGYGARASVMRNLVTGNAYTGARWVSGGILVVGGPGYGGDFCVNTRIVGNTLEDNDVGVYVSQYEADFSAPTRATNIKVVNNLITSSAVTNGYVYQAGVSDVGNNDKIIGNTIAGAGYDPATLPGSTFDVDADVSFTNRPKVHANR